MDPTHGARRTPAQDELRTGITVLAIAAGVAVSMSIARPGALVLNLDPVAYSAIPDYRPGFVVDESDESEIASARFPSLEMTPALSLPPWEGGFICTSEGWRHIHGGAVIFWGKVLGSEEPPRRWRPPHSCLEDGRGPA